VPDGRRIGDRPLGVALGVYATVVWGAQFIVVKSAYAHVGPIQINAIRYVPIAAILCILLARLEGPRSLLPQGRARMIWLLGLGVVLFNILNYVGLRYTRPQSASLISGLSPLFAVLLAWGQTRVRPARVTLVCVLAALVGVVLVISHGDPASYLDAGVHWGDLLCGIGVLAFAAYTIGASQVTDLSPLRLTALSSATAAVMMVVLAIVAAAVDYDPFPTGGELWDALPAILYIALPGAVVAMLAWNRSARLIGGQNTALLMNLVPVTVFVIQITRGYHPAALEYAGALLAIGAVTANNLLLRRAGRRDHALSQAMRAARSGAEG
jgi:drug/metabolite transporter (DMT)-like permease